MNILHKAAIVVLMTTSFVVGLWLGRNPVQPGIETPPVRPTWNGTFLPTQTAIFTTPGPTKAPTPYPAPLIATPYPEPR